MQDKTLTFLFDMRLPISLSNTHLKNAVETFLTLLVLSSTSANNSYLVWLSHKAGRFSVCFSHLEKKLFTVKIEISTTASLSSGHSTQKQEI